MGWLQDYKDKRKRKKELREVRDNSKYISDGANNRSKLTKQFHEEDARATRKFMLEKMENIYQTLYARNDIDDAESKLHEVENMKGIIEHLTFGYDTISLNAIKDYFDLQCQICNHCANFSQIVELNNAFSDLTDLISDLDYSPECYRDFEYARWLKDYTIKLRSYYEAVQKLDRTRKVTRDSVADMRKRGSKDQEITRFIENQNKVIKQQKAVVENKNEALRLSRTGASEIRIRIESMGAFDSLEQYQEAIAEIEKNREINAETANTVKEANELLERDDTRVTDNEMNINIQEKEKQSSAARTLEEYDDLIE
ncbi:MAG: hypothetical protein K5762_05460 [Bacilli bacterium]|nr:hypothetical protein [Bacilli bacterium]